MFSSKLVALVAALLAEQAVALNAHRHAHNQFHAKKDVVYVNDVVTVTDWTIVTVYDDGAPAQTTAPKAIYKGADHTEHYSSASSSANSTSSSLSSSSFSSSSSSISSLLTSSSSAFSSSSTVAPTTLATSTKPAVVSSSTTSSSSTTAEVQAAQAQIATTSAAAAAATTSSTTAAAATTATSSSSSSSKRGLAYNSGSLLSPFLGTGSKCSWSYNWGQVADSAAPTDVEFVPMLWGPTFADGWAANAESAIANGVTNFLSFNECDNAGQCNLDAASAAAAHIEYLNPYSDSVRISTPAITNSNTAGEGVEWLANFITACDGQCAYDFCAAHWYNGPDTSDFLSHLTSVYETCGKPVWITEFAPTGTDDEINTFLETVLDALDNNSDYSFVERYSYFMVATGSLLSSTTSLSTYGDTYAYN